ncbi:syntenin-1-like [Cynocephalus volans]
MPKVAVGATRSDWDLRKLIVSAEGTDLEENMTVVIQVALGKLLVSVPQFLHHWLLVACGSVMMDSIVTTVSGLSTQQLWMVEQPHSGLQSGSCCTHVQAGWRAVTPKQRWDRAQTAVSANPANPAVLSEASAPVSQDGNLYPKLYPELSQYMGLSLNEEEIRANMAVVPGAPIQGQLVARPSSMNYMVAPVTGNDVGIRRAEIKQGICEVILCKDQDGKIGLRLKSIDNGIFVQLVQANSPASLVGLRFGDQVLQINGENCAGWSSDKAHKVLKQAFGEKITMIVCDRPFERTITMHKDSTGHVGFIFKNGKITSIVKDSSAARNGLLTEHNICEINGQNVIGLKDSQIADILSTSGTVVTITIMPAFIFEHIIKRMAPSIMKSLMDHTIPEV